MYDWLTIILSYQIFKHVNRNSEYGYQDHYTNLFSFAHTEYFCKGWLPRNCFEIGGLKKKQEDGGLNNELHWCLLNALKQTNLSILAFETNLIKIKLKLKQTYTTGKDILTEALPTTTKQLMALYTQLFDFC